MSYQPGDVANGHVLNGEGQWLPVAQPFVTMRLDRRGYWARWLRRWKWSALGVAALVALVLATTAREMLTLGGGIGFFAGVFAAVIYAVTVGTAVNFVVAALPSRRA